MHSAQKCALVSQMSNNPPAFHGIDSKKKLFIEQVEAPLSEDYFNTEQFPDSSIFFHHFSFK